MERSWLPDQRLQLHADAEAGARVVRRLAAELLIMRARRCLTRAQRAYLTREQCDAVLDVIRAGDAAAMGLWVAFESRSFADFLSFLQPLQVIEGWR